MPSACVRVTDLPNTSKLFADFVYHPDRVARFYGQTPQSREAIERAAARIDYPEARRTALVEVLRKQNGESAALETLSRPGTVAVVTGQQVGLFSGPAYTVYKALTAAAAARRLTEWGIPAVPIFWLATEDHDYAEVNHCWVFGEARRPVRIEAPADRADRRPVGQIPAPDGLSGELRAALAGLPFADDVASIVESAYAPGATFGSGFAALMRRMLQSQGLLYLDPLDPDARRLAAPLLRDAVQAAPEITARVLERNRELEAAGYHAQVHVEEQTSFVFLLEDGRRTPLTRNGDEYAAGDGRRFSSADLAARAADLSPNALLRPVIEDFMLPTAVYVGGPAELAYLAQAQVIYERLLGRMPVPIQRQSMTLLDARASKLMSRYGLALTDLFHGGDALVERLAAKLVPPELGALIARAQSETDGVLDELGVALGKFDGSLRDAFQTSRRKIGYQLAKIERKVAREALRRSERAAEDAARLMSLAYPNKRLQERTYSMLPFLAAHGPELIDRLAEEINLDCPDHRVIVV